VELVLGSTENKAFLGQRHAQWSEQTMIAPRLLSLAKQKQLHQMFRAPAGK